MKTKLILTAVVLAFAGVPMVAMAAQDAPKVSYAAKKQGRVSFEAPAQEDAMAQDTYAVDTDVTAIEPAAGAMDIQEDALSNSLKLPRK